MMIREHAEVPHLVLPRRRNQADQSRQEAQRFEVDMRGSPSHSLGARLWPSAIETKEHHVRRLTFTFRNGKIELISDQHVDMTLPARPATRGAVDTPFWYELRDKSAAVLHRLTAPDPIPSDTEVFSDDPDRSITRSPIAPQEGVFTVVIPDVADVEEIGLMRAPGPTSTDPLRAKVAKTDDAPIELGRFKIAKKGQ